MLKLSGFYSPSLRPSGSIDSTILRILVPIWPYLLHLAIDFRGRVREHRTWNPPRHPANKTTTARHYTNSTKPSGKLWVLPDFIRKKSTERSYMSRGACSWQAPYVHPRSDPKKDAHHNTSPSSEFEPYKTLIKLQPAAGLLGVPALPIKSLYTWVKGSDRI